MHQIFGGEIHRGSVIALPTTLRMSHTCLLSSNLFRFPQKPRLSSQSHPPVATRRQDARGYGHATEGCAEPQWWRRRHDDPRAERLPEPPCGADGRHAPPSAAPPPASSSAAPARSPSSASVGRVVLVRRGPASAHPRRADGLRRGGAGGQDARLRHTLPNHPAVEQQQTRLVRPLTSERGKTRLGNTCRML